MIKRSSTLMILYGVCATIMAQTLTMSNGVYWCQFNTVLQIPTQVRWIVSRTNLGTSKRDPSWRFVNDVPAPYGRATHDSYTHSGYDRGHMAPASDFARPISRCRETFRISNICPQTPALNRGLWKKTEIQERSLAISNNYVRVLAIPLILKTDTTWIGNNVVAVPDAFIKVIYDINPDTLYNVYFLWNK